MVSGKGKNPRAGLAEETTLPGAFFHNDVLDRSRPALLVRQGDGIVEITRAWLEQSVKELATGLIAMGIGPGERVAIIHENSPEWITADLAIASAGAVSVPVYTTLGVEETAFLLRDSSCTCVIFSGAHEEKVLSLKKTLPFLTHLISTAGSDARDVLGLEDVSALGRESGDEALLQLRMKGIDPHDPFSIIYSSGTTGRPKGVVLSHANILSNIEAVLKVIKVTPGDLYLSYLPLSHIFERMVHHLLLFTGTPIAYSRCFAYVGADMAFFKPTFMVGVPLFFERIKKRVLEAVRGSGALKRFLFDLAARSGRTSGRGNPLNRAVLKGVRDRIGPSIRFFISGGAALSRETVEFFEMIGLPVLQGYGLTETSPVVTVNTLEDNRPGTVGRPVPGVEVRIAEDGEILVKGPNVMNGYLNLPETNRETIRDGWLHTGDIGVMDEEGFLTITDRKKDIIVTSAGKNIPPQRIETILKADEYIKEALVYGDSRPHLVALIVPDEKNLEMLAKDLGLEYSNAPELLQDERLHGCFEERIRSRLAGLARFEQIRRFALIEDDLSQEGGELTPTMKVRREKVALKYKALIDSLYE